MPINVNDPEYVSAEKQYYESNNLEEKLIALKKMISHMPGHKGAENLRAQLKTRLKKFQVQLIKSKKSGKSSQQGIRKEDMQAVLVGKTNSGKSSLLSALTNAEPKISQNKFTTMQPIVGMMDFATTSIQLIEIPSIESETFDKGIVYTADSCLILIDSLENLNEIEKEIKTQGEKIIVFTKTDLLSENEKRKITKTEALPKISKKPLKEKALSFKRCIPGFLLKHRNSQSSYLA